jgi:hypothetical protein
VGLYTCDTRPAGECGSGERPTVTDVNDDPLGDFVALTVITIQ